MLKEIGKNAKDASYILASAGGALRNAALEEMAAALGKNTQRILSANRQDLENGRANGMRESLLDRLALSESRLAGMQQGIREVADAPDPLGLLLGGGTRPNGLRIEKISVPLGVIGVIFEARPNVTSDAAALCVKSGNAVILRGGKEAIHSNTAIADALRSALEKAGLPKDCVQLITDTSRESSTALMTLNGFVDVLIPRGGAGLIQAVVKNATVPVIETGAGVCHIYVDKAADIPMALRIVENAKTQRPSVCNAIETVLIHADILDAFLPLLAERLSAYPVALKCDVPSLSVLQGNPNAAPATQEDWPKEYGDLTLSVKTVAGFEEAVAHIRRYGTGHSECIVTNDYHTANAFVAAVDCAAVYVNASTRFTDGGEFGFGAEIGISTQKLHARGPLGLRQLTSEKYCVYGNGQVR
ncbi:MAG: glutamate-5-semialdehyde dehydrogenase [Oscillospiraceae bacterium]|jgi:glutamate-5-semialdehyde dehydrogenase|nr:glutamate-5-semialdehyde dehydrogenase [Oscillospiraceae bacterium]